MSILFEQVTVLTMDGSRTILKDAYVSVESEKISYVGTQRPEGIFDRIINGKGKILMPGFVNKVLLAHSHSHLFTNCLWQLLHYPGGAE